MRLESVMSTTLTLKNKFETIDGQKTLDQQILFIRCKDLIYFD